MAGVNFTREAAKRIGSVVRTVERWVRAPEQRRRRQVVGTRVYLCVFRGNLRADGDEDAGTPYVLASRKWTANPRDESDLTFKTSGEGQELKVWPWKIPDGYQIPDEWEVWIVRNGGRWYPLMPEDCLQLIPEE